MEKVTGIGGVFFRARDPDELRKWYATHLGVDRGDDIWSQEAGPTEFAPFKQDTDYFPEDRQWMINLRVRDMDAMKAQLEAAGIDVKTNPEWDAEGYGRFARIHDPEGNPIELWEPPASPD